MPRLWLLSVPFFMVIQIIGGNLIQSNTISGVMSDNFGVPALATGIFLVILIFVVTLGGLKRLAHVTQNLVPLMAFIYVAGGLIIILLNITKVPGVIADIFTGAFGLRPMAGGAMGSMMIAMQKGVARGLYSNEAGEGSAPVIHSSASVSHPAEQGITGVTEFTITGVATAGFSATAYAMSARSSASWLSSAYTWIHPWSSSASESRWSP